MDARRGESYDEAFQQLVERSNIKAVESESTYPFKGYIFDNEDVFLHLLSVKQQEDHNLDLRGAILRGLDLRNEDLTRIIGGLSVIDSKHYSPFSKTPVDLQKDAALHFEGVNLTRANLRYVTLDYAYFDSNTILSRTIFDNADLTCVYFEKDCILFEATFIDARLHGVHFKEIMLQGVNFNKAIITDVYFEEVLLEGAQFVNTDLKDAHFRRVNLSNANLRGAILEKLDLSEVNLEGAQLGNADLTSAHLVKTFTNEELKERAKLGIETKQRSHAANLDGAFFDERSNLRDATIANDEACISLADVHWNGVNLGVVKWNKVLKPWKDLITGDERELNGMKSGSGDYNDALEKALRANRQFAIVLRNQGMNEYADIFAYRARLCQRKLLAKQKKFFSLVGSHLLGMISGYGYKPFITIWWYIAILLSFAVIYDLIWTDSSQTAGNMPTWQELIAFSIASFHGRGFFPNVPPHNDNFTLVVAGIEAIFGLIIELVFIATFTQRYFSK